MMGWVCKYCSTNNEDLAKKCIVCDHVRSYTVTRTLTAVRVSELGLSGNVVIPKEYNAIGAGAFQNRTDITSVTIHSGVKRIQKEAFYGCVNLRDVHNHAALNSIGARAFYGCRSLPMTKRPTARYVHKEAFAGCEACTSSSDIPEASEPFTDARPLIGAPLEVHFPIMPDAVTHTPSDASRAEETRRTVREPSSGRTSGWSSGFKWFARVLVAGIAVAAAVAIVFIFKQVF